MGLLLLLPPPVLLVLAVVIAGPGADDDGDGDGEGCFGDDDDDDGPLAEEAGEACALAALFPSIDVVVEERIDGVGAWFFLRAFRCRLASRSA